MATQNETRFKRLILPHFEAGYNLARWLLGSEADASDVLQESCIKALRFGHTLQTENAKSWFLQIVRNTSYTFLRGRKTFAELEDELEDLSPSSEELAVKDCDIKELRAALDQLPETYREILVLRELEEMSYEEISSILEIPQGTVMSRLARAREQLRKNLERKEGGRK